MNNLNIIMNNFKVFKDKREIDVKSEPFLATPKTLLLHFNEAAYTTTRTVNFTNVLDFATHFQRLAYGTMRKMMGGGRGGEEWSSKEVNFFLSEKIKKKLSDRLINSLTHSLLSFHLSYANQPIADDQIDENSTEISRKFQNFINENLLCEARVYLILSPVLSFDPKKPDLTLIKPRNNNQNYNQNYDQNNNQNWEKNYEINYEKENEIIEKIEKEIEIWTYIEPLPSRPTFASIEIRKHPKRDHADLKSSEWVRNRQDLEQLLLSRSHLGLNECILLDPLSTEMYEGLSSNFFIVDKEGRIVTAEDEFVLVGTVMKLILEICERLAIPVVRTPPSLHSLSSAKAAFISSTTRLLLPVDKIYYPEHEGGEVVFQFDYKNETLTRIQTELMNSLLSHSFKII